MKNNRALFDGYHWENIGEWKQIEEREFGIVLEWI